MKPPRRFLPPEQHLRLAWIAVGFAGVLALVAPWLTALRVSLTGSPSHNIMLVTSEADEGPGSLRAAILMADRADGRARVLVRVRRVSVRSALPPLVNPHGIALEAHKDGTDLNASPSARVVLDLAAPHMVVDGFRIAKAQTAVVVRASHATLERMTIEDADTGVLIGDTAEQTTIERSTFRRNRVGVQVSGHGAALIANSRFDAHGRSAIWAAAADARPGGAELQVFDNRFESDKSSIVLVDRASHVEANVFENLMDTAVFVSGARTVIQRNRILAGRGFGIFLDRVSSSVVHRNEIAHNCSGGAMLRYARNTEFVSNNLYKNGFGVIVFDGTGASPNTLADNLVADHAADGLLLIATSPIVRRNRVLHNAHYGLRLASITRTPGDTRPANPLLEANVLQGNRQDEPYRDEYVSGNGTVPEPAATECTWRLAAVAPGSGEGHQ